MGTRSSAYTIRFISGAPIFPRKRPRIISSDKRGAGEGEGERRSERDSARTGALGYIDRRDVPGNIIARQKAGRATVNKPD